MPRSSAVWACPIDAGAADTGVVDIEQTLTDPQRSARVRRSEQREVAWPDFLLGAASTRFARILSPCHVSGFDECSSGRLAAGHIVSATVLLISLKWRDESEMIAESICCWLYSKLPVMKARSFIVRALLFALVLAPASMRVSARPLSAPSCRVAKPQLRASHAGRALDQFVVSRERHRTPTPRLRRIRGKRLNTHLVLVLAPRRSAFTDILTSDARLEQQDLDGPNPSRGPPSQLFL
jgi:hypothetical protein